jgi:spore coat protein U-like protein
VKSGGQNAQVGTYTRFGVHICRQLQLMLANDVAKTRDCYATKVIAYNRDIGIRVPDVQPGSRALERASGTNHHYTLEMFLNTKFLAAFASLTLCAVVPASAFATTPQSQSVSVSATVATDCALSVPSVAIPLGSVDPLTNSVPPATTSSVSVNCNAGSAYTIGLGASANTAPTLAATQFTMTSNGHALNYTASLQSYGATPTSSAAVPDVLTLAILTPQDAYVGSYAGSFFVTIAF